MQRCIDMWNCTRADRCAMVLRSVDWTGADRCAMVHRSVGLNRGRSMRFGAKICVAEQGQIDVQWCIDLWGWTGADRCEMVHKSVGLNRGRSMRHGAYLFIFKLNRGGSKRQSRILWLVQAPRTVNRYWFCFFSRRKLKVLVQLHFSLCKLSDDIVNRTYSLCLFSVMIMNSYHLTCTIYLILVLVLQTGSLLTRLHHLIYFHIWAGYNLFVLFWIIRHCESTKRAVSTFFFKGSHQRYLIQT